MATPPTREIIADVSVPTNVVSGCVIWFTSCVSRDVSVPLAVASKKATSWDRIAR